MHKILFLGLSLLTAQTTLHAAGETDHPPQGMTATDWSSIRSAYEEARHRWQKQGNDSYHARNHSQQWHLRLDHSGFTAKSDQADWHWGLELSSIQVGGTRHQISAASQSEATANRVTLHRNDWLEEWFINDQRGLEQGWTLKKRPASDTDSHRITLSLLVRGKLLAEGSGGQVQLRNNDESTVLTYGGLKAWDATGRKLPAKMEGRGQTIHIEIHAADAVYPVTIDPIAQEAVLRASNREIGDYFGATVDISGDTAVIGAYFEDGGSAGVNVNPDDNSITHSGAAYVFVKHNGGWTQQAYLKASNPGSGDYFGGAVAISGDTIAIAARGEDGDGTSQANDGAIDAGAVYVFVRSPLGQWSQQAYIKAAHPDAGDFFGASVDVDGDVLVIGALNEDGGIPGINGNQTDNSVESAGAAYIFERSEGAWTQQAYLKALSPSNYNLFGESSSVSGGTVVVGSAYETTDLDFDGTSPIPVEFVSGAVYVYTKTDGSWERQAYLSASNRQTGDRFGCRVALSGDTLVVGASEEDSGESGVNGNEADDSKPESGAAYVFQRTGTTWAQEAYLKAINPDVNDRFGDSVAISGQTVVVGSQYEQSSASDNHNDNSLTSAGAAYVFHRTNNGWAFNAYLKSESPDAEDHFGVGVAIDNKTILIGADRDGGPGNDISTGGAAFVFNVSFQQELHTIAKSNTPPAAFPGLTFNKLGTAVISPQGDALLLSSLKGTETSGGANSGAFVYAGDLLDLLLQKKAAIGGVLGFPANAKIASISRPIFNGGTPGALLLTTVSGAGLNAGNNQLLMLDDGTTAAPLYRTGLPVPEFQDAKTSKFREVVQHEGSTDDISFSVALKKGSAGVKSSNDSGLLRITPAGSLVSAIRESAPTYDLAGTFGQLGRISALSGGGTAFLASFKASPDNKSRQSLFFTGPGGDSRAAAITSGELAGESIPGTRFRTFTGIGRIGSAALLRATLSGGTGSPKWKSGVWTSANECLMIANISAFDGSYRVKRIIRVWGIDNGQMVAHVIATGPAIGKSGKAAVVLVDIPHGQIKPILIVNHQAPGIPSAQVSSIQAVDVEPVNGHYVILGGIKGFPGSPVPAASNQVLWSGNTGPGNNANGEHLPSVRLRKGDTYDTNVTTGDTIRGMTLKPIHDSGGAGNRGMGQIINAGGQILLEITNGSKAKELIRLTPPS